MSNKRVKSMAVDDDDYYEDDYADEYQEDGELSAEDREQLRLATIKVRQQLGSTYNIPEKAIHDALWNYYYDVGKTISYLKDNHKPLPGKSTPAAPNKAKSEVKPTTQPKGTASEISTGLAKIDIQGAPRIKSKNLDVLAEFKKTKPKRSANFVVVGHIDAGKSTLMGRLLYDLKAIDQRTIDKYKKEAESIGKGSFAFAWVLDQGTEERERGVTMDIAQNTFSTSTTNFTILDAPGHRDFVPNMIAGASQADFAVLVIDGSGGNFESGLRGQTKEHALLVRSIGVQQLIVAVNKMDTTGWSKPRFNDIQSQLSTFLLSAGYSAQNITFVPCSGLEGGNIFNKIEDSAADWYTGPTLVAALESIESSTTFAVEKPLRMTVADIFWSSITNPLSVSGRIEAGSLQIGDNILIQPSGETAVIKAIDLDDSSETEDSTADDLDASTTNQSGTAGPPQWAVAGNNVTLHLIPTSATTTTHDLATSDIRPGDVLCSPTNSPIQNVTKFTAKLLAFDHLMPMSVDVHRGRLHKSGVIAKLIETLDKNSGQTLKKKPRVVQPQSWVRVQVDFVDEAQKEMKVALEAGNRVILRAEGSTVAVGVVE